MERKVQILERKLKKEQKERIRLKALRSREALHRTEMEEFFLQCIEVCDREQNRLVQSYLQKNRILLNV